jgi:phosphopentomutase
MESLDTMRKQEFRQAVVSTPLKYTDSRFGHRKSSQQYASKEEPSIFSYANPGRGVQGEHQN